MSNLTEAVRITFPYFDQMAKLLQETHTYDPPYTRQSTATAVKPATTPTTVESFSVQTPTSTFDHDCLRSSDRSQASSTVTNSRVSEAEAEIRMASLLGDNDEDIQLLYKSQEPTFDDLDGFESDGD